MQILSKSSELDMFFEKRIEKSSFEKKSFKVPQLHC